MANSSYVQTAFFGGEISQAAQGRLDLPIYKQSMNVCLNGLPIETGAWMRRPGSRLAATTRGGARGRVIPFPFAQASPYLMEFTDGFLRFLTGPSLVMTNDAQSIASISTANPAVIQTATAHGWSTGNSVLPSALGVNNPLLQNRVFTITVTDTTHFSIADAITGATIDGSTLGTFVSGTVSRVLEIATTYSSGAWSSLRSVQAETRSVLLNGTLPQVLQLATDPTPTQFATFTLGPANFIDGPYLDPVAGSIMTPSGGLNGVITLTLSFAAYDSTKAYNVGDFATFSGQGYQSLTALNQGNQPNTHPANWKTVNGGAAVNNGSGFVSSDIGRLIRLFSEPAAWSAASTYAAKDTVSYPDGSGGNSYWTATAAVAAGIVPGTSTLWAINATAAQWTWAQVVTVSGAGLIAPATAIGSLSSLSAAFDGNTSKTFGSSSTLSINITTYPAWSATNYASNTIVQSGSVAYRSIYSIFASQVGPNFTPGSYSAGNPVTYNGLVYQALSTGIILIAPTGTTASNSVWGFVGPVSTTNPSITPQYWTNIGALSQPTEDVYVGQRYGSATTVLSGTLYPTSDVGLANLVNGAQITVNLRASNNAADPPSGGTLLGSAILSNTTSPVTVTSGNTTSTFTNVWFEIVCAFLQPLPDDGSHNYVAKIGVAQAQFFAPNISNGSVVTAQIRGPALLYNLPVNTWRAGVYSNTTGWPTCGAYHEGRLWLGGVVSNRFDAGVSNGIDGTELDFTPTSPDGTVSDNNAISYVCNGKEINQLLWMEPDQQGVLFGTQEGPWLISAPSPGAMSPTNIKAVRVNGPGSANIEPKRSENTLLYVHRFARKVVESFADVFSGKYTAPNLSERAKHLTVNGIAEIAYQQELAPIFWCRRNDGALVGATYKRDTLTTSQGPTIIGWHRHAFGSGRLVESICAGPSQNGNLDTLSMVTNDPNTGIRHVELLTDLLDEGFALTSCWFLDDAIVPSSTVVQPDTGGPYGSLLVNGLWALNGKTVTAFIAGLDCGDYTVSSGSITVPFGDGVSGGSGSGLFTAALVNSFTTLPAVVGFTYNSDGQVVRPIAPSDTGAQAGPGFAKIGRASRGSALLYGCVNGSITFGSDFSRFLDPAKLRYANDVPYPVNVLWNGIWRDNIDSELDFDGMICWRISRPLPAFVMAAGAFDSKADV